MLWEILGLGAGSMPLTFRFSPPIGGILYWLRPGTIRLPPWPEQGPADARHRDARPFDVALYAACSPPARLPAALRREAVRRPRLAGRLDPAAIGVLLGLLALLGLRDKVAFLASRPEIYGCCCSSSCSRSHNMIVASQLVLRLHLVGRRLVEAQPALPVRRRGDDQQHAVEPLRGRSSGGSTATTPRICVPRRGRRCAAHLGTAIEFTLPLMLLVSRGGTLGTIARGRDDHLPRPHHLDVPARRAAGVEPVHDLRGPVPVRPLRRRAVLDARRSAAARVILAVAASVVPMLGNFRPGQGLVPAGDALLRRQLGDEPVAVPQGERRGGEARPRRSSEAGADRRRAAARTLRPRDGRAAA